MLIALIALGLLSFFGKHTGLWCSDIPSQGQMNYSGWLDPADTTQGKPLSIQRLASNVYCSYLSLMLVMLFVGYGLLIIDY
jgi:hypothetical protein